MTDLEQLSPTLRLLLEAALAGGREALAVYATDFSVCTKADESPVSEADSRAEAMIIEHLQRDFPGVPIVAEEAVADGHRPETGARFFLVDPLDGTKEFIKRNGEFTVNIGLIENGCPVAGVVLAPALRRLWLGADGAAFAGETDEGCEGAPTLSAIRARPAAQPPVAVASRSHSTPETEDALARIDAGERRSTGSSLKFCLVASGEADFYPRMGPTMEWDTAAGDAVLRAAGGQVTRLDGTPLSYGKADVVGMRPYENPFFLAAGDSALIKRYLAADGGEAQIYVLETKGSDDYALLDSGHGRKLERFGAMTLSRPEEQAIWTPRLGQAEWDAADAAFTGDVDEEGAGRWRARPGLSESWMCRHGDVRFFCRLTSFRHVGVFPEQEAHWRTLHSGIAARGATPSLLNLFGYTGIASLLAAEAGARVTHVDASRKAIAWARENQVISGLDDRPIRWICDDAGKFVARESRRGSRYDGILLDPPKFGRGPKGETWRLFEDLPAMLRLCREILAFDGFLILTAYAIRASCLSLHELTREVFGDGVESGELVLVEGGGRRLSTSLFSCWSGR